MPWWLEALNWLGNTVYVAAVGLGVVAAFLGLPGTPLVLLSGVIFCAAHHWSHPPVALILGLIPFALVIELLDNVFSMAGVRRFGGSSRTMWWVLIGGLCGALLLSGLSPVVGLAGLIGGLGGWLVGALLPPLLGGLLGGYLGGYLYERQRGRPPAEAGRAGWGALVGRLAGGLVRGSLTLVMALVLLGYSF